MTPRNMFGSKASNRQTPKPADIENYNDEIKPAFVDSLRERYAERLRVAKPKSEANW